jgi:hypothetical protein
MNRHCKFQCLVLLGLVLPLEGALSAQSLPRQISANQLVRQVIRNEIELQSHDQSLWTYHQIQEKDGTKKSLLVCQTKDGEIDRLMAVDDHPLTPKERTAEDRRIHKLSASPVEMRQEMNKHHDDSEQTRNLLKIFPDAFWFQYDGMQDNLVKLIFTPNPNFRPSGHPAQVFHQMEGRMLVDEKQMRLAEIHGQLASEVKFGGGVFGHLDKGGTFSVKLQDVGSGHWEMTLMDVQMNGKVLFFKTIAVREKEIYEDFQPLAGDTTARQADELMTRDATTLKVSQK